MLSIDSWLHPLRAYPRGFVLACFALTAGMIIWAIVKTLKWSLYAAALLMFLAVTGTFAFWLWA